MSAIDPDLRIRSVTLAVSDLPRSADFYEGVLGLKPIGREQHQALLGADPEQPSLLLTELSNPTPLPAAATGLYHVAWLHPSRAALAESVRRIVAARWPFDGAADHGVSEALYLSDPDGLGIEIYADRPREQWQRRADGHGLSMATLPLDLEDLLAQFTDAPAAAVAPRTGVGHVHLKVADVARAAAFYRDALGLEEQAQLPAAAFLAAGGYHHHVGLNSWQSGGAAAAPDSAPGLRRIEFELSDARELDVLQRRLAEHCSQPSPAHLAGEQLSVHDPDGQLLSFGARAG